MVVIIIMKPLNKQSNLDVGEMGIEFLYIEVCH